MGILPLIAPLLIAGFWALRQAWRGHRRTMHAWIAALAILMASAIAVAEFGAEIGTAMALAVSAPAALIVVYLSRTVRVRTARASNTISGTSSGFPYEGTLRVAALLLTAPLALAIGGALAVVLPFEPQTRVIATLYLLPLLWSGAMAWVVSATNFKKLAITAAGIASLCAIVLIPRFI